MRGTKNQYIGENCLKVTWAVCRFKKELGKKEEGGVFEGVDTSIHTMGKVGGWGILRNGNNLSNGEDDFEMGGWVGMALLYGMCIGFHLRISERIVPFSMGWGNNFIGP